MEGGRNASDVRPPEPGKTAELVNVVEDPRFECCVCLDLLYKPAVIACGHMSCFWCVHKAMHVLRESHCPVCRQTYQHFPSICQLLHHLLLKLDPVDYQRREKEVLEEEKRTETFSPQIIEFLNSNNKEIGKYEENRLEDSETRPPKETSSNGNIVDEHSKKIKMEDVSCSLCKELLYQPAVLNCGHVYCISCLASLNEEALKCQVCGGLHPGNFPNVCLDLDHFLEEYFPAEYESRAEKVQCKGQFSRGLSSSGTSCTKESSRAQQGDDLSNVHIGVGCDSCGVYPIRGNRYKCQDCTESIGFDLCEACYKSSSKLPGRFNQQHTPEHRMKLDNSSLFPRLMRFHGIEIPEDGPGGFVMEEALVATGAMLEIVVDNQEAEVQMVVDNQEAEVQMVVDNQEAEGNGEEHLLP